MAQPIEADTDNQLPTMKAESQVQPRLHGGAGAWPRPEEVGEEITRTWGSPLGPRRAGVTTGMLHMAALTLSS